jgi:SAM-dependent methyltransferase
MGKSDPYVFSAYKQFFNHYNNLKNTNSQFESVCFLGQDKDNGFTKIIEANNRDFFDISLENWNINEFPYSFERKYDLIVCTRCPYFCNDPSRFLKELSIFLNPGGRIFLDWGLGDHLRYEKFRVGFQDENEKEQCYFEGNYMSSCLWDEEFMNQDGTKIFNDRIKKYGYENLNEAVHKEVPNVVNIKDLKENFANTSTFCFPLWEEMPQLYIIVQGTKK